MLDGTCINNGAPQTMRLLRRHVHDPFPKSLFVAPYITPDTFALATNVRFVHALLVRLYVCCDRGLFPVEQQLVCGVRELRVGVRHVPEHAEHTTNAARAKYFDAGTALIWRRGVRGSGPRRFGDAQGVTQEGQKTHSVVRCQRG